MQEKMLFICEYCGEVYRTKEEAAKCEIKCIKELRKEIKYKGLVFEERKIFPIEIVARVKYDGKILTKRYIQID